MTTENNYKLEFVNRIHRLDYETIEIRIQQVKYLLKTFVFDRNF